MRKFDRHKWWIITAVITAPLVAVAAGAVPNVFSPNTVISSAQVNANFAALQSQADALNSSVTALSATVSALAAETVPAGTIVAFGGETTPPGWLNCDGSSIEQKDHPVLFSAIGTTWGNSSPTSFNLPDLRGMFLRGVNGTRANVNGLLATAPDPDVADRTPSAAGATPGAVGSAQLSAFASHVHPASSSIPAYTNSAGPNWGLNQLYNQVAGLVGPVGLSVTVGATGSSSETRPINVAVMYIIKD